jgi:hypothetical protein
MRRWLGRPLLGAYAFFVSEHQLPREFDDRVELHSGAAYLRIGGPLPTQIPFTPDAVGIDMAERFGHAMERLYHPRSAQRQRPDATQ